MNTEDPYVLGIDPGLNVTGYGVLRITASGPQLHEAGVIRSHRRDSLESRLREIHDGVAEVLASFQLTAMAIEELYTHYERPQVAILMGHARGGILLAAAQANVPVISYAATRIKKILTGNGRAPKSQMQQAVCHELGLGEPPEPADVADALAIALCHHYLGNRLADIS